MKRVLSLSFPNWSIDLVRRRLSGTPARTSESTRTQTREDTGERTILLTTPRDIGEVVAACCTRAADAGVHPEMTFANAHALLAGRHELHIERANPEHDRTALHVLATWALQFSPITSEDPPDGLLLDGFGLTRLFGSEAAWMRKIRQQIARLGITVRAAIADTIGCAWALARFSPAGQTIVDEGREREALAALPVQCLRLSPTTLEALFEVGVDRVEHLFTIPRQDLARRFGEQLLLRLDQALGHAYEIVKPSQLVQPIEAEMVFDGPVRQLAAILETVERLCQALCKALSERQVSAREVRLDFVRFEAAPLAHTLALTRPTTDAAHITHLLHNKTERTCLGSGIEQMRLIATKVSPPAHHQSQISMPGDGTGFVAEGDTQISDRQLGALFDVLIERCSPERVVGLDPVASHIPEQAYQARPFHTPPPAWPPHS